MERKHDVKALTKRLSIEAKKTELDEEKAKFMKISRRPYNGVLTFILEVLNYRFVKYK